MKIDQKDIYELVDPSHDDLERTFEIVSEKILQLAAPLRNITSIGTNKEFSGFGVAWKYLKSALF